MRLLTCVPSRPVPPHPRLSNVNDQSALSKTINISTSTQSQTIFCSCEQPLQ